MPHHKQNMHKVSIVSQIDCQYYSVSTLLYASREEMECVKRGATGLHMAPTHSWEIGAQTVPTGPVRNRDNSSANIMLSLLPSRTKFLCV